MTKKLIPTEKILLVEDEESLAKGLIYNLTEEGYNVDLAIEGKQAIEMFDKKNYDLILLDIMLPYYNGFEVAEYIRKKMPQMLILMLTARTSIDDKLKGLEIGADDYITKPFHLKELLLRIEALLRRKKRLLKSTVYKTIYRFGNNEINFENLICKHNKLQFQITQLEAILLKYLIENKGRIISRKELLENVWGIGSDVETRTVDIFICRLRKYFEDNPSEPIFIRSVRSAGYLFDTIKKT